MPIKTGVPNLGGWIVPAVGLAFIGPTTDQYLRIYQFSGKTVVSNTLLWPGRKPYR